MPSSAPDPLGWAVFAALAALVAADAGPFLISLVGRPLPAAALLGLLWGDPLGGAAVGALLELVYAGTLPVGAARYPEAGLAGLVGAGTALAFAPALGHPSLVLGLGAGLGAGQAGKGVETWRRSVNARRVARARAAAASGDPGALSRAVWRSLAFAAALGAAAAAALLGVALLVAAPFVDVAPGPLSLRPPPAAVAALGCGAALRLWSGGRVRAALGAGLAAGAALGVLAAGGGAA